MTEVGALCLGIRPVSARLLAHSGTAGRRSYTEGARSQGAGGRLACVQARNADKSGTGDDERAEMSLGGVPMGPQPCQNLADTKLRTARPGAGTISRGGMSQVYAVRSAIQVLSISNCTTASAR